MPEVRLRGGLPFVTAELTFRGSPLRLDHVLIDTGSGGSVFSADRLFDINVRFERDDPIHRIRGVGGTEFVFGKRVDLLALGELVIENFEVEVGLMEYGFELDGILGMNFLLAVGAVLDLSALKITLAAT